MSIRHVPRDRAAIPRCGKMGFVQKGRWREAVFRNGKCPDFLQMSCLAREFGPRHEA
jgi:hypothetical protein